MPLYEWRCPKCNTRLERAMTVREMERGLSCGECGSYLQLLPSRPAWFPSGKYGKGGGCNS